MGSPRVNLLEYVQSRTQVDYDSFDIEGQGIAYLVLAEIPC